MINKLDREFSPKKILLGPRSALQPALPVPVNQKRNFRVNFIGNLILFMHTHLFIEYGFKFQLTGTEHEIFADYGARMSAQGSHNRSELNLSDAHCHWTPVVNQKPYLCLKVVFFFFLINTHRAVIVNSILDRQSRNEVDLIKKKKV